MQVITTVRDARIWRSHLSSAKVTVGLVPTMGALHEGHLSLLRQCSRDNEITAATIFINPAQFNEASDFERYPRNLEKDLEMLSRQSCGMVFAPCAEEMYPEKDLRKFDFGTLDKTMEGVHRPGHFNGVAQIVSKLLTIMEPDRAYFGDKDFQQLAIIKALVRMLNLPVEVIGCPIIREDDGLAMSSRNQLMSAVEREAATLIPKTLAAAVEMKNKPAPAELKEWVMSTIDSDPLLETEYFEIVDEKTLSPVSNWTDAKKLRACIAVRCGFVRLIDNMNISY